MDARPRDSQHKLATVEDEIVSKSAGPYTDGHGRRIS
jgi:hypothetical protein